MFDPRSVSSTTWRLAALFGTSVAAGCGDDGGGSLETGATGGDSGGTTGRPPGCDEYVVPTADDASTVQAVFTAVRANGVVCLAQGTFMFTRSLSLDAVGVTVRGAGIERSVLDFSGQSSGAQGMLVTGDDATLQDLQVLNTPGDGVRVDQVEGITLERIRVAWDTVESVDSGAYGLHLVQCSDALISESVVVGARGAGIYVGQSNGVLVQDGEVYGNVAGIEIDNSTRVDVRRNNAHDNTVGILVLNVPGFAVQDGRRTNVYDNAITTNNVPNFAEPNTLLAQVPTGVGVLVVAADETEVAGNVIRGNNSTGVAVLAYVQTLWGAPTDPQFDIYSEGSWVHDNEFGDNATEPDPWILQISQGPNAYDIVLGGCANPALNDSALDNCISNNGDASFLRADVCMQNMGVTTNASLSTCEKMPLPRQ